MCGKSTKFDAYYREIAIADLDSFQIMIPTDTVKSRKPKNPLGFSTPRRIYSDNGWVHLQGQIVGQVQGLRLKSIVGDDSPFKISPRLSIGIPASFEICSQQALPVAIAAKALFLYQFEQKPGFHYALFQDVRPRFVRIYPSQSSSALVGLIEQFLIDEGDFIHQRQSQLSNVDFYREQFNL